MFLASNSNFVAPGKPRKRGCATLSRALKLFIETARYVGNHSHPVKADHQRTCAERVLRSRQ
jgi:hypothetical protein